MVKHIVLFKLKTKFHKRRSKDPVKFKTEFNTLS